VLLLLRRKEVPVKLDGNTITEVVLGSRRSLRLPASAVKKLSKYIIQPKEEEHCETLLKHRGTLRSK